ncbi:hypothetical protein ON010_g18159 [Phytophthora cinnamomi]|nr:hypothetical protein ON010_g18159 [Phytophthora cinnamomi]
MVLSVKKTLALALCATTLAASEVSALAPSPAARAVGHPPHDQVRAQGGAAAQGRAAAGRAGQRLVRVLRLVRLVRPGRLGLG